MAKKPEFQDVKVVRKGDTITVPDGMSLATARKWLEMREQEEDRVVEVSEKMDGFPVDCLNALATAIQDRYGFKELRSTPGFMGENPPSFITTPIDHTGKTIEVFIGRFGLPKLHRQSYLEPSPSGYEGIMISGEVKAKELPEVKALIELARQKLKTDSIYKNKSIRVNWVKHQSMFGTSEGFETPEFMAPPPAGAKLLVNDETMFLIEASIWAMIRKTEMCRKLGIPLKRSTLCCGPFGTGKTLLAAVTAVLATQHGWTFIYLKNIKQLKQAYIMAARYAPAVLFAEDLDQAMTGDRAETHSLLNVLDGIDTKGSEVMLILTTNYPEKLDTSILRPGRLDAVIPFVAPDAKTAQALIRHYAGDLLPQDTDLTVVGEKLEGRIPSVIREAVERAKLHVLAETESEDIELDEVALVRAATGMNHHLKMLDEQAPKPKKSALEDAMELAAMYFAHGLANVMFRDADIKAAKANTVLRESIQMVSEKK